MPSYRKVAELPGKSAADLYKKVSEGLTGLEATLQSVPGGADARTEHDASAHKVTIFSKFINATLVCHEGRIELNGALSWIAMPFKSKIDEVLDRWLKKTF